MEKQTAGPDGTAAGSSDLGEAMRELAKVRKEGKPVKQSTDKLVVIEFDEKGNLNVFTDMDIQVAVVDLESLNECYCAEGYESALFPCSKLRQLSDDTRKRVKRLLRRRSR
jgi:hypothetical protein